MPCAVVRVVQNWRVRHHFTQLLGRGPRLSVFFLPTCFTKSTSIEVEFRFETNLRCQRHVDAKGTEEQGPWRGLTLTRPGPLNGWRRGGWRRYPSLSLLIHTTRGRGVHRISIISLLASVSRSSVRYRSGGQQSTLHGTRLRRALRCCTAQSGAPHRRTHMKIGSYANTRVLLTNPWLGRSLSRRSERLNGIERVRDNDGTSSLRPRPYICCDPHLRGPLRRWCYQFLVAATEARRCLLHDIASL